MSWSAVAISFTVVAGWALLKRARRREDPASTSPEVATAARSSSAGSDVACPHVGPYPRSWRRRDAAPSGHRGPDVTSTEEWNAWWAARGDGGIEHHFYVEVVRALLPFLRRRPAPRVLVAGCGVALDVRAFAAAGIRADGLDISTAAIAHARECPHFEDHAEHFLSAHDRRAGGRAEWHEGSLLDASACPGPYDAVVCRKVLQYFWSQGRLGEALDALTSRLAADGVLLVTSHGSVPSFTAVPAAVLERGYAWDWKWRPPDSVRPAGDGRRLFVQATSTG